MKIIETSLRDGHQSLLATRLTTTDILDVIEHLDQAGFYALEVWGGATFDACLRFLNEDPWIRLKLIKKAVKNTKLQMLLRGQNLLGYKHYADDVVDHFIKQSIFYGIDIIRMFDALNDLRNLETSIVSTKKYGAHAQVALAYTTSPIHTIDYYVGLAKEAESLGADSICIKDMAGLLLPDVAFNLIVELKKAVKVPISLHGHATTGTMMATYLKAYEAGVDMLDTAMSPFAGGTSQPPTEALYHLLKAYDKSITLDTESLLVAEKKLTIIKNRFIDNGMLNPKVLSPKPNILHSQVPGGMLSNLISQLTEQKMMHAFDDILEEIPRVRKDFGYPPLVTPLSQLVGVQASLNVMYNKRYGLVPKEVKDYIKGLYGKPPTPIDQSLIEKLIGDEPIITERPADLIEPSFDGFREKYGDICRSDRDVLSIALFGDIALQYINNRNAQIVQGDASNQHLFEKETVQYKRFYNEREDYDIHEVKSPVPGVVITIHVKPKQKVDIDQPLFVLASGAVNVEVLSPIAGTIQKIHIHEGKLVEIKHLIITIK